MNFTEASGARLEVGVLGPTIMRSGSTAINVTASKERGLLSLLAIRSGTVVSTSEIIEALWGDIPPFSATKGVQTYISKLRRTLQGDYIQTRPPGYLAEIDPSKVDALEFEAEVGQARRLFGRDPSNRAQVLSKALDLWRGDPLIDLCKHDIGRSEASRLKELRLGAEEERFNALLEIGQHSVLVGDLMASVEAEPLREERWAQLMLALYRSGRQAEALRCFQQLRKRLAGELGISPSSMLASLESSILNNEPELAWQGVAELRSKSNRTAGNLGSYATNDSEITQLRYSDSQTETSGNFDSEALSGGYVSSQKASQIAGTELNEPRWRIPLPIQLKVRPAVGVIGRSNELATLSAAVKRVSETSRCETLLISGETGNGKTTLVAEAAREAHGNGAVVLFGHCEENLLNPYQLFCESFDHYVANVDKSEIESHIESHGTALARLVPSICERAGDLNSTKSVDVETERYLLFAAAVGLLSDLSRCRPVVLVLDDLQWADQASLQLLRHIVASSQPMHLLVCGIYRNTELGRADGLVQTLGAMHREGVMSRLELTGLDGDGVVSYMEASAGHSLHGSELDFALAVHRETDGNPFFVSEILHHLFETSAISRDQLGHWEADGSLAQMSLPDSVREVIAARVVRLGPQARLVLSFAAVIGKDFDLPLLSAATKRSEDELLDILEAASAAALVDESSSTPGNYSFTHALIQFTLYENLGITRKARTHRQIAEALEGLDPYEARKRLAELAHHWSRASGPWSLTKAIRYAHEAAAAALASLAPYDALRYYLQAIDLHLQVGNPDEELDLDLRIGLGTAQRQTADQSFRQTLLEVSRRSIELGDAKRLVISALANDRGITNVLGQVDEDKVEVLEAALKLLDESDPERAVVISLLCKELSFVNTVARRQELADHALAIAEESGNRLNTVRVLNNVGASLRLPQLLDQSLYWSAKADLLAGEFGDPLLEFWAARERATSASCAGLIDEADQMLEKSKSLAEQLGQPTINWIDKYTRSARAMLGGDLKDAERLARDAYRSGATSNEPEAAMVYRMQLISLAWQSGTMSSIADEIEKAAVENPDIPEFQALLAVALQQTGRNADLPRHLESFCATGFELPWTMVWITGMIYYAEAAIQCKDPEFAAPMFETLEPFSDQFAMNGVTAEGPVGLYVAGLATVLRRFDTADEHFSRAYDRCSQVGAKSFLVRTNLDWADMILHQRAPGYLARARSLASEALDSATGNSYEYLRRRAIQALEGLTSYEKIS